MKIFLAALGLVLASCAGPDPKPAHREPIAVEVSVSDRCTARLVATPAHPFLAEFDRQVTVTCGATRSSLELQRDPGGLGRVELVRSGEGLLAITDAFQSTTVRTTDASVLDRGLHEGKQDGYATSCARTQSFTRTQGQFLGAFDFCDHRWQFLPPS